MKTLSVLIACLLFAAVRAEPPKGKPVEPFPQDQKALDGLRGKISGKIIWSCSQNGNHDIFIMNADATDKKALTQGPKTDWFPRFSPDGSRVLFTRSKMDWTLEAGADNNQLWDTWIINMDGTGEKLLIKDANWATWRPDGKEIVFARNTQVLKVDPETGNETLICSSEDKSNGFEKAAVLQNPNLSPDGRFLAITLRGKMRETGIWDVMNKAWVKSGDGCQINWFASGNRIVRIHPTGNGGNQVVSYLVTNGKPANPNQSIHDMAFMDLPGRASHEYFPVISSDEKWLVWGATQRGHDHDTADYEIYLWKIGTPQENAVRLTFHTSNDRWPDIHLD